MHYYIISGELSGDLYGAELIKSLQKKDSESRFTCWGGQHMKNTGVTVVRDLSKLSFVGFFEVFQNSFTIINNYTFARKHIKNMNPDVLILIDYPGFNLKIAKYAKKIGIPVFWFIAPQVWAWKKSRVYMMRKYIDKLFVVLPFELDYFSQEKIETYYFGHPLLDLVRTDDDSNMQQLGKPVIALMPGSRNQEINTILPVMLSVISSFPSHRFVIICASSISRSVYENLTQGYDVELKFEKSVFPFLEAAIVASGTATLELAIYNIPQIVCYKLHPISYYLARWFAKIKYISLVNILANKPVLKELIQSDFNVENVKRELSVILRPDDKKQIIIEYNKVKSQLGQSGCFDKISEVMYTHLIK
tara:strand:+ start:565 stop:1650 length:1086 start_codon:yes stop_codon:yes gene_type:complete